jgi:hypothetical protein
MGLVLVLIILMIPVLMVLLCNAAYNAACCCAAARYSVYVGRGTVFCVIRDTGTARRYYFAPVPYFRAFTLQ